MRLYCNRRRERTTQNSRQRHKRHRQQMKKGHARKRRTTLWPQRKGLSTDSDEPRSNKKRRRNKQVHWQRQSCAEWERGSRGAWCKQTNKRENQKTPKQKTPKNTAVQGGRESERGKKAFGIPANWNRRLHRGHYDGAVSVPAGGTFPRAPLPLPLPLAVGNSVRLTPLREAAPVAALAPAPVRRDGERTA